MERDYKRAYMMAKGLIYVDGVRKLAVCLHVSKFQLHLKKKKDS